MKKHIRDMIDDLRRQREKYQTPATPQPSGDGKTVCLDPPPDPALPQDLENQVLSNNPVELEAQLDFQAQQNEERETLE